MTRLAMLQDARWTRRGLGMVATAAATTVAAAGALGRPGLALAHANLDTMDPPAGAIDSLPDHLTLTFSGLLDRASTASLLDVNGTPIDGVSSVVDPTDRTRLIVSLPPLPAGPYTVGWTSVSAEDGHELSSFYALLAGGAPVPVGPQPPVRQGPPAPDLALRLDAAPDDTGIMQWTAAVSGATASIVQRVILRFTPPLAGLGIAQVTCQGDPSSSGYWVAQPIALAGDWQVEAVVRRLNVADDLRLPFVWTAAVPA